MISPAPNYKLLRCAFEETLNTFGEHGKKAIIDDLESRTCRDEEYLELADACESLERYFGEVSPEQTLKRVWMRMSRLDSARLTLPKRVALA